MINQQLLEQWDRVKENPIWYRNVIADVAVQLIPQLLNRIQELEAESLELKQSNEVTKSWLEPFSRDWNAPEIDVYDEIENVSEPKGNTLYIYTDGGSSGNPGNGGWGYVVAVGDPVQDYFVKSGHNDKPYPEATNNEMEIMAAIKALKYVAGNHSPSKIIIRSDSQYLVYTMSKGWKRKANQGLWNELDHVISQINAPIEWEWIERSSHPLNKLADSLSNKVR